jgi:hypothetical protein
MTARFDFYIKQFYKIYLEETGESISIDGEYWFDEDGNTMYADGDVGDMNHEMYVEERVLGNLLNYFNLEVSEFKEFSINEYYKKIKDILLEKIDQNDEEALENLENEFWDDPKQIIEDYIVSEFKENREKIHNMLYMGDAREYAIKEWNWSRVHRNNIEVNRLTSEQLNLVSSGIWNALSEEGKVYTEEDRIDAGETVYYISTYTGKRYSIKLNDMNSPDNISDLEESPTQIQKGFATIDKMDKENLTDFYKNKPFGDSYKNKGKLLNESFYLKIDIEKLLPDKNNMEIAIDSLHKGMYSDNKKPIDVYKSGKKYIVADGHHRLLQAIINQERSIDVKILPHSKISRSGTVALDLYAGDFYGLDTSLENGWLIKRL